MLATSGLWGKGLRWMGNGGLGEIHPGAMKKPRVIQRSPSESLNP